MIRAHISDLTATLGGRLSGEDAAFRGVATDTRSDLAGRLFAALTGERFDGHDFVPEAQAGGAVAALTARPLAVDLPQLVVPDPRRALGLLARSWRQRFDIPVAGITGSNGKTTVKEMLAEILGQRGPVLTTPGNLNNDIGVPLTLFDLGERDHAAVIEMGCNRPGDIAYLSSIARPGIGLVTNAGLAHLEGLGSVEGVARTKGELFESLPADGIAVINRDDPYFGLWRELAAERTVLTFGLTAEADVRADPEAIRPVVETRALSSECTLHTPSGSADVRLPVAGRHNIANALAAAAVAEAMGASLADIRTGLSQARTVPGRLRAEVTPGGATVLDDTYNANPSSLDAALELLSSLPRRRWLVLGDMGELGKEGRRLHYEVGERARAAGVERLYGAGELAEQACRGFGECGRAYGSVEVLAEALASELPGDAVVLVKGSRSMRMERVVEALSTPVGATDREGH